MNGIYTSLIRFVADRLILVYIALLLTCRANESNHLTLGTPAAFNIPLGIDIWHAVALMKHLLFLAEKEVYPGNCLLQHNLLFLKCFIT